MWLIAIINNHPFDSTAGLQQIFEDPSLQLWKQNLMFPSLICYDGMCLSFI